MSLQVGDQVHGYNLHTDVSNDRDRGFLWYPSPTPITAACGVAWVSNRSQMLIDGYIFSYWCCWEVTRCLVGKMRGGSSVTRDPITPFDKLSSSISSSFSSCFLFFPFFFLLLPFFSSLSFSLSVSLSVFLPPPFPFLSCQKMSSVACLHIPTTMCCLTTGPKATE